MLLLFPIRRLDNRSCALDGQLSLQHRFTFNFNEKRKMKHLIINFHKSRITRSLLLFWSSEWIVPFKPFSFREFGDNSNQYTILFLKLFKLIVILNTQYGKSSLVSCSVTTRENYQPLPTKHHGSSHNRCQHIDTPQAQPPSPSRFPYQRFYLKICPILLIIFYQLLLFFLFIKQSQSFAV